MANAHSYQQQRHPLAHHWIGAATLGLALKPLGIYAWTNSKKGRCEFRELLQIRRLPRRHAALAVASTRNVHLAAAKLCVLVLPSRS